MTRTASPVPAAMPGLLAEYVPSPGVADELLAPDGSVRPLWRPFIDELARLTPDQIAAHFARGDQYLRDAGVFFRHYSPDSQQERDWPLSHVPVLLHETEWAGLCDGLAQRADLLESVVADLYGPGRLVTEGHLPAELVAQNPEWLRPLVGVKPASGHFLHFLAFEVGRSPDGSWLVLGDRAQAPSGAGFALENRLATARVFPEPFPRAHVHRLAGFFRAFRDAMQAMPTTRDQRTAILTPGPGTDTYFEHSYIARYLGMLLLEGEDLIVENGQVMVRTVSGPHPLGVLWRRLDAAFADPLELDETSRIGTPGLVDALRRGSVSMVNALGSGILETRALMAFMPKLSQVLTGAPLRLPNVATWWCGQPTERAHVRAHADTLFIGDALSRSLPFDIGPAAGAEMTGPIPRPTGPALGDWIEAMGPRLVGQQAITLSTTPAWVEGRLMPRPMSIRVFAARTAQGWTFLPGGYARIGRSGDAAVLAMQQGGSVADVWVLADGPVPEDTMLEPGRFRRHESSTLPSRVADNLFWLGRYIERTEGAIRLMRAYHLRRAEAGAPDDPRLVRLAQLLAALHIDAEAPLAAVLEPALGPARQCAARVRDRFSVDGWAALTDLTSSLHAIPAEGAPGDETARLLGLLLRKITGFNGLVHENMHRSSGWRFLTLGRALERADGAAAVLATLAFEDRASGLLDVALEYGDSRITHQRRYRIEPTRETIVDLLVLDRSNPRSVQHQVVSMVRIAADLPFAEVHGRVSDPRRLLMPLEAELTVAEPAAFDAKRLKALRATLAQVSASLSALYLG